MIWLFQRYPQAEQNPNKEGWNNHTETCLKRRLRAIYRRPHNSISGAHFSKLRGVTRTGEDRINSELTTLKIGRNTSKEAGGNVFQASIFSGAMAMLASVSVTCCITLR